MADLAPVKTHLGTPRGAWLNPGEIAEHLDVSPASARGGLRRLVAAGQAISHKSLQPTPKIADLRPDLVTTADGSAAYTGKMELFRLGTNPSAVVAAGSYDTPEEPPPPPPDPAPKPMWSITAMDDGSFSMDRESAARIAFGHGHELANEVGN